MMAISLSVLLNSHAYAVTYYVDYAGGSDSNKGTSTSTPWKYAPGMSGVSGVPAGTTLSIGDTVILKGGVTWTYTSKIANLWVIPTSGITIKGGQRLDMPWGRGYPVLDASGTTSNMRSGIVINGKSNITIDGIKIYNTEYDPSGGSGISFSGVIKNLEVKNCYLDHTGDQSFKGGPANGSSHILIHDNITSNVGRLFIAVQDSTNVDDIQIYNNTFLGPGSWPGGLNGVHGDGIMIGSACTSANNCLTNLSIHHNKFSGDWAVGSTALIFLNNGTAAGKSQYGGNHVQIYNNQLTIDTDGVISPSLIYIWSKWNDVKIYNNTFGAYIASKPISSCLMINDYATNIQVYNNIFSGCTSAAISLGASDNYQSIKADYNFYSTDSVRLLNGWPGGKDCRTISACQAPPFNQELHGKYGDPMFLTLPNGTPGSGNWNILAFSPAVDAGVSLTSYFTNDINNTPRPQGYLWDIGAFEY